MDVRMPDGTVIRGVPDDITRADLQALYEGHDRSERAQEIVKLLARSGPPGKDGRNGIDGRPGRDGKDGAPGKDGARGKTGEPGAPGRDGKNGRDGKDGKDGVDGAPGLNGQDAAPILAWDFQVFRDDNGFVRRIRAVPITK